MELDTPWRRDFKLHSKLNEEQVNVLTTQGRIFNFLERPVGCRCYFYHGCIWNAIFACIVFSILATTPPYALSANSALYYLEVSLLGLLSVEYLIRIWSCGCRSKYTGIRGRLQFARTTMPLIDLISLVAATVLITTGSNGGIFSETALRGLRFVDIIRLLRIDRQGATWRLLGSVVYSHRKELLTTMYLALISLIFASYFIFVAEKEVVDSDGEVKFKTYADALWWGMVTFYTIGYGDLTPLTWIGKILTCLFCLTLTAFFQVPAGILGSGFALRVHQNQREKQQQRQIPAAATLIQTLWRCYSSSTRTKCLATWRMSLCADTQRRSLASDAFDGGTDLGQQRPCTFQRHGTWKNPFKSFWRSHRSETSAFTVPSTGTPNLTRFCRQCSYEIEELKPTEIRPAITITRPDIISEAEKNMVHAVCRLQFLVAKRKFQQVRQLYDVRDVIEQHSQGHRNMMLNIRNMQRKIEQALGKSGNLESRHGHTIFAVGKLVRIEQQVKEIDSKLDQCLSMAGEICGIREPNAGGNGSNSLLSREAFFADIEGGT